MNTQKQWLSSKQKITIKIILRLFLNILIFGLLIFLLATKDVTIVINEKNRLKPKEVNNYSYEMITNKDTFVKQVITYEIIKPK